MNLIEHPFLPQKKVGYVIANNLNDCGKKYFYDNGIKIIELPRIKSVDYRVNYHSDLFCMPLFDRLLLCSELSEFSFPDDLKNIKKDYLNNMLSHYYPKDVFLNALFIGNNLICNIDTISEYVLQYIKYFHNIRIINVNQGYTKCSVCPVSEKAFITDDKSIYEKCFEYFDVLLLEKGLVELDGFDYGFIGGAAGKTDVDKLVFTGRFYNKFAEAKVISFCEKYNVNCIWLSDDRIYDIGSIIPITEA